LTVIIRLQVTKELTGLVANKKLAFAGSLTKKLNILTIVLTISALLIFLTLEYLMNLQFGLLQPWHIVIVIIVSGLTFNLAINRALMRAYLIFKAMAINTILQAFLRLIITTAILLLEFKLSGVLFALVSSYVLTLFSSFIQLKNKFAGNLSVKIGIDKVKLSRESFHTAIGQLGLTSLISIDLIMVQYFLPNQAGFYAGLSLFGKALLFTTTPFSTVLFPMIISSNKKQQFKLLTLSIILISAISFFIFLIFNIFADILIRTLLSKSYLVVAENLSLYTIFIAVYCIANLIIGGFVALNKYVISYAALLATIVQIVGITFFHQNLNQVIYVSLITTTSLTIFCIIDFVRVFRKEI